MDQAYPFHDDPVKFQAWLYDRLATLPNIIFERDRPPLHSSYDDWNVWGTLSPSRPELHRSSPSSPSSASTSSASTSLSQQLSPTTESSSSSSTTTTSSNIRQGLARAPRPTLLRLPSRDISQGGLVTEKTQRTVNVRVSRHILRLQRQYSLLKTLGGVDPLGDVHIRALQLVRLQPRDGHNEPALAVLLLEHQGSYSRLQHYINYGPAFYLANSMPSVRPFDPDLAIDGKSPTGKIPFLLFLSYARAVVNCCAVLHSHNIIHGEIRPDAFYYDEPNNRVRLVNHGPGLRAFEHGLSSESWNSIAKTHGINFRLQFIAPEQTGRLPVAPDSRTDYYSVGIVFYYVLTGELPFPSDTALGTLRSMLSRRVPSVSSKRIDIPQALSAVISKMVQRNMADRYHSVQGIRWDLDYIANQYDKSMVNGESPIPDDWKPGQRDAKCTLRIPDMHVGREKEIAQIMSVLSRLKRRQQRAFNSYTRSGASPDLQHSLNGGSGGGAPSLLHVSSSMQESVSDQMSEHTKSTGSMAGPDADEDTSSGAALSKKDSYDFPAGIGMAGLRTRPVHDGALTSFTARASEKYKRGSKTEIILVEGGTGMGKTRLVNDLMLNSRDYGFVASARFEATNKTPFAPLIQLVSSLFRQIFLETKEHEADFLVAFSRFLKPSWAQLAMTLNLPADLLDSHLANGQQSVDGASPPSIPMGTLSTDMRPISPLNNDVKRCSKATKFLRTASKNSRFQGVFIAILRFLARHKPVFFVLEDVDGADAESIELLGSLAQSRTLMAILLTTHSRADLNPQLTKILNNTLASVHYIMLKPLSEEDVSQIFQNTLERSADYCYSLVAVCVEKCDGNPLYVRTFLEHCHAKGVIVYCWTEGRWRYDLDKIFQAFAAKNIQLSSDFITSRLQSMSPAARQLLAIAARMGTRFKFSILKAVMQQDFGPHKELKPPERHASGDHPDLVRRSSQDAVLALEALLSASILISTDDDHEYEFCHARYRIAAGELKESADKEHMSNLIVHALFARDCDGTHDTDLFLKAAHILTAVNVLRNQYTQRKEGRDVLAKAATACIEADSRDSAAEYWEAALKLLQDDPWDESKPDTSYEETLFLHMQAAECLASSNIERALQLANVAISKAKDAYDSVPAVIIVSRIHTARGHFDEGFRVLVKALKELDVELPPDDYATCDDRFHELIREITQLPPYELENRPINDDPRLMAVSEMFAECLMGALVADSLPVYRIAIQFLDLTLHQGITAQAGLALTHCAAIANGRFDNVQLAVQLGIMAESFFERFDDDHFATGRGLGSLVVFTAWLHRPFSSIVNTIDRAVDHALASNDMTTVLFNCGFAIVTRIWASYDAAEVEASINYTRELADWTANLRGGLLLTGSLQFVRAMQGKTKADKPETVFCCPAHDTETFLEAAVNKSTQPGRALAMYKTLRLPAMYLYGHYDAVIEDVNTTIKPMLGYFAPIRAGLQSLFYVSLAYIQKALASRTRLGEEARTYVDRTMSRAEVCSSVTDVNLAAWTNLIQALTYEVEESYGNAVGRFEAALDHAEVQNSTFEVALVSEHYGEFLCRRGGKRPARNTLRDAISAYKRISYTGKAAHLMAKHEWLLMGTSSLNSMTVGTQTGEGEQQNVEGEGDTTLPLMDKNSRSEHSGPTDHSRIVPSNGVLDAVTTDQLDMQMSNLDVVDIAAILSSSRMLNMLDIDALLSKLCDTIVASSGAEMVAILVDDEQGGWTVAAISDVSGDEHVHSGESLDNVEDVIGKHITISSLRFKETLFTENFYEDERFANVGKAYRDKHPGGKSVLMTPILHGGKVLGGVYVQTAPHTFTGRSITIIQSLLSSVGISIRNAKLFRDLQKADAKSKLMIESQRAALAQAREAEKRAAAAKEEALENLRLKEEAAKAKSELLANTSHELRTPLNGVIGMSELLKSSQLTTEQSGYIDSIRVCADTLLQVINDILDYSKLDAGKMQLYSIPLSLKETIVEVVRALSYSNRGKDVETITDLDFDEDLVVNADPIRLHQILMNLLSNAYKFTAQGKVTIKAVVEEETSADIEVTISVQDTGIGIDDSAKKKLFMPFSQADSSTSRSYGGTGLGLSICKAIIENAMSGSIWLESQKGVGTSVFFKIRLRKVLKGSMSSNSVPKVNPMSVYTPEVNGSPEASPTSSLSRMPQDKIRIAIAEDNLVNQKLAIRFVQKLGFPVEAFLDGQQTCEALEKAAADGNPFHIVLMDCQMPRLDGYDATRRIRKHSDPAVRDVVIIAMTASAIRGDREKCLEAGMNNYLAKPIRQQMLSQMLDHYVKPAPNSPADGSTPVGSTPVNGANGTNGSTTPVNGSTPNGLGLSHAASPPS